jgi:hypothetical protein
MLLIGQGVKVVLGVLGWVHGCASFLLGRGQGFGRLIPCYPGMGYRMR